MSRESTLALVAVMVLTALIAGGETSAATFTAELELVPATNRFGQYVTASYDFGVRLTNVQEVRLELDVPDVYEGTIASTGNNSWYQALLMNVQDSAVPLPAADVRDFLGRAQVSVSAGPAVEITFPPAKIYDGFQLIDGPWPEFLVTGAGRVWFTDLSIHTYRPLPDYEGATTTATWSIPEELVGARLIITADAVPEPTSCGLICAALSWLLVAHRYYC